MKWSSPADGRRGVRGADIPFDASGSPLSGRSCAVRSRSRLCDATDERRGLAGDPNWRGSAEPVQTVAASVQERRWTAIDRHVDRSASRESAGFVSAASHYYV